MENLNQLLFSPIGKEWCLYFKILMYLMFFMFIIAIIGALCHYGIANRKDRLGLHSYLLMIGHTGLSYFVMRLFYSMCIR